MTKERELVIAVKAQDEQTTKKLLSSKQKGKSKQKIFLFFLFWLFTFNDLKTKFALFFSPLFLWFFFSSFLTFHILFICAELKKVNVDYQDGDGMSALHQATLVGNVNIMKLLLDAQASASVCDSSGRRPLHFACWQGRAEPVDVLLKVNIKTVALFI